ncbi:MULTISPECIES: MOSC and FAD-binding oxidoreductase domain-containing protein [Bradyrhizobium]|uniref:MOSC and FAD-binding oxidoreductase domain-containing protein n=1 Tax=Bradyrhizobium elkanii TaxID=29448 RepID=UPI0018AD32C9|nr:MOSC and FAD-binding oxidoreductase domain-containing protein [Bradyrhizobium elkanii]
MLGLAGDAQADLVNHGGVDKAVYGYPSSNYAAWQAEYPHIDGIGQLGSMGENLSISELTERTVHIGDVYRIGGAVLQVTQPRKPCFKLALRFDEGSLPSRLVSSGRCGFYFRVLETGRLSEGASVELVDRLHNGWSIFDLANATYSREVNEALLSSILEIKELASAWRKHIEAAISIRAAERFKGRPRTFRVRDAKQQSDSIRSFTFEPADGNGVLPHRPGQFLTLRLRPSGRQTPLVRTYSLTNTPNGRDYSMSVKREGEGSSWLHENAIVGSEIEVDSPKGRFVLDGTSRRPLVLLSAGVGIAPVLSILRAAVINDGVIGGAPRKVLFVHGTRNRREHAHSEDVDLIASKHSLVRVHIAYSQPDPDDKLGEHYHSKGRIDAPLLKSVLPLEESDFYVCGPGGFMKDVVAALSDLGVQASRIGMETFGPSSLAAKDGYSDFENAEIAREPVTVRFAMSEREAIWKPGRETLLELAEELGITVDSECRSGNCGTCAVRLLQGSVSYAFEPSFAVPDGEALLCCSRPAASDRDDQLIVNV